MIKPLDPRKQTLRAELDADVAKWLAKGNTVTKLASTRPVDIKPWAGTDAQAGKQLANAARLAASFRIGVEKFLILTRSASFPMAYLHNSEPHWIKADVKKWHVNWRKG